MRTQPLLVVVLLALSIAPASASWAWVPLRDLVPESDLVVVATLHETREFSIGDWIYGCGALSVHEVLCGDARAGARLSLRWRNIAGIICPIVDPEGWAGRGPRIRLLERGPDDTVEASYPGRVLDLAERRRVAEMLRRRRLRVIPGSEAYPEHGPYPVMLVARNATAQLASLPRFEVEDGQLRLDRAYRLVLRRDGRPVRLLPGALGRPSRTERLDLPPRSEHGVEINLVNLYGRLPAGDYNFDFGTGASDTARGRFLVEPHRSRARMAAWERGHQAKLRGWTEACCPRRMLPAATARSKRVPAAARTVHSHALAPAWLLGILLFTALLGLRVLARLLGARAAR